MANHPSNDASNNDRRDLLEVLKAELAFVEKGGYGRYVRTPWTPTSIFQDSPTCINFNSLEPTHPCTECMLHAFIPAAGESEKIPCHHIPLNQQGETVHSMERQKTQAELEETLRDWLRERIARLEREHASLQNH